MQGRTRTATARINVLRLRRSTRAPRPRGRNRKLRLLAVLTLLVLLAGTAFTFGLVRAVASEIPTRPGSPARGGQRSRVRLERPLRARRPRGDESRVLLKDIDVSPIMRQAIVSVEDRRFYEHNGVDRAASCARSSRTSAPRPSSRPARRSRSSSSRTPTSATRRRSRARCARLRSPGSSSRRGRRIGFSSRT